jgi:hypothetical protein
MLRLNPPTANAGWGIRHARKSAPTKLWRLTSLASLCLVAANSFAADAPKNVPADYKLVYQQDFEKDGALRDFVFSDAKAWKVTRQDGRAGLELIQQSDYKPSVRSPFNIALIADKLFGDFILEAELMQTGKEYGHRDMCLFFGFQEPNQFYYAHIATAPDDHAHNLFIVNKEPRVKFAKEVSKGANWGLNVWHKVRLERKASDGSVRVFFDDMTKPIMVGEEKSFGAGYVGFGSFDDTGKISKVRIWAASAQGKPASFFERPPAASK